MMLKLSGLSLVTRWKGRNQYSRKKLRTWNYPTNMEDMDIEELKKTRTTLKTKVSTCANRLTRGVARKSAGNLITNLYQELEVSYSDFEEVDEIYNNTI